MNKEKFIKKYGENNTIKQIFLRKAYQNYQLLKSQRNQGFKNKINKSVENSSFNTSKFKTDQSKQSFLEMQCTTHKDSMQKQVQHSSQIYDFHYNQLKNKWLIDQKSYEGFIQSLQEKKKLIQKEEQQRELELSKIQQALLLRQNIETERKKQFYKDADLFRSQQSERKKKEFQEIKQKEKEYQNIAKKMAENEQLAKLEQQIVHRQKCRLQFQMLEQQRKTNSFLFS